MLKQHGQSLFELMCAIGLLSLLLVSSQQLIISLVKQQQRWLHRYQLDQHLNFIADRIAKSLQRAGYCPGPVCPARSIILANLAGEMAHSCVIFYRQDWQLAQQWLNQAYRLHHGNIEIQRNVHSCQTSGWERLLPADSVVISQFVLRRLSRHLYQLQLHGYWHNQPGIKQQMIRQWWSYNQ